MSLEVRKKSGESGSALLYSFTKRIKRSGILKEARARRFKDRPQSRLKRKLSAIHRDAKRKDMERQR
ncbi:MAG: 30S ribosomal protein S21, partial [Candidatus Liptonbacteria bacterium]|nr:30S ribosomal protein S21 [Candidatus Liptonbacteria bacterium]